MSTQRSHTYSRKIGKTTVIGGTMRWDMIQLPRCSPPVRKRARLYAQIVPRNMAGTVLAPAITRLCHTVAASPSLKSTA